MLLLRQAPLLIGGPGQGWRSPVTIPRLWLAAIFAACSLFAAGMGVFSTDSLHRLWGLFAAVAYVLAAGVVLAWKSSRAVATWPYSWASVARWSRRSRCWPRRAGGSPR